PRLRPATTVVRYGIDVDAVRAESAQREKARQSLGIEPDELVVGTVANLRATKGYPELLAAASPVIERLTQTGFFAVGAGPLAAARADLRARRGLGDRFRFLGYRADALELMSAFDVFCLASRHEGLSVALMEALAFGLPVVATTAGGTAELA